MNKYIDNINAFLGERKIKQKYVSLVTGWTASKVSRILSGESGISDADKNVLAEALGYDVEFFMGDPQNMKLEPSSNSQLSFFAGSLSSEDMKVAESLVDMFRFYDSIVNLQL
ncbi:MAG: helix-turn-helix transcriptional regulator [Butyrivibrio sp.]|nr:helix-turn-helix transcriptional regulator [Butyrivibrio sp.]